MDGSYACSLVAWRSDCRESDAPALGLHAVSPGDLQNGIPGSALPRSKTAVRRNPPSLRSSERLISFTVGYVLANDRRTSLNDPADKIQRRRMVQRVSRVGGRART